MLIGRRRQLLLEKEARDQFLQCTCILTDAIWISQFHSEIRVGGMILGKDELADGILAGVMVWPCISLGRFVSFLREMRHYTNHFTSHQ